MDDEQLTESLEVENPLTSDAAPEDSSAVSDETLSGDTVSSTETAAPEQAATPEFTSIRDYLGGQNFDSSRYQSDEEAVTALLQRAQQSERAVQEAAYWRHIAQQNQQSAPQPQAQSPAPPAVAKKTTWPQAPEWNSEWEQGLTVDPETRAIVAKPGYDPTLPQKYAARKAWEKQSLEKLLSNPVEAVWEGMQERFEAVLAEREKKILETYQRDLDARQYFERQVMPRLYVTDPGTGQPRLDPTTGQYAISPWGQAFSYYLNEASQMTPDPVARRQYAERLANAYLAGQPAQAAPQPAPAQPSADPRKQNFLKAQHRPSRAGTEAEETPNRSLSFGEKLRAELQRTGHISESAA